ncbi:MAG: glycosyl transferase family 17, partial [Hyphomicrobiales bacterium]|nr:glycosyl transferase family 17 [Hyphomicrobiales bacterium]
MSEAGLVTSKPDQRVRRVFDCVLYNGEIDVLAIRLNELDQAVDCFVIVESTLAFDGSPRTISLNPRDPRISRFAAKLRHVIVADMPETDDATAREAWQRNATLRGVPDAEALDLMILSNVGEIPRRAAVSEMLKDDSNQSFGFCLSLYYLHLNYYRVSGPQTELASCIAATRQHLDMIAPDKLRLAIQNGDEGARIFQKAGWHYSGMVADTKDRPKDVHGRIPDRPGGVWEIQKRPELPNWVTRNRLALSHLFYPFGTRTRFNHFIRR